MRERTILLVVLLGMALVAVGVGVAALVRPFPELASDRAALVDQLLRVAFGLAAAVFVGAEGLLLFAAIRGRIFPTPPVDPPAVPGGSGSLELLWISIPAAIVLALGVYSFRVLAQVEAPPADPLRVEVTASQYQWEFHYPESGLRVNELHLPLGRPARLEFRSLDVIHSFWVPAFGGKVDAHPDRVTTLELTPTRAGVYEARCTEFCGAGHSGMLAQVRVEPTDEFETWVEAGGGG